MVNFLVGAALGFLSGLGVGGGSLLLLWMTLVLHADPGQARVMNLMFFVPCALIATLFRRNQSRPGWKHTLCAAGAGLIGALLGNLIAPGINRELLRKAFGVLFILSGIRELRWKPKS